jgi:hypothetical protein
MAGRTSEWITDAPRLVAGAASSHGAPEPLLQPPWADAGFAAGRESLVVHLDFPSDESGTVWS